MHRHLELIGKGNDVCDIKSTWRLPADTQGARSCRCFENMHVRLYGVQTEAGKQKENSSNTMAQQQDLAAMACSVGSCRAMRLVHKITFSRQ